MLGVAEGGVWPATLILLSDWFPRGERARANAWFMLCIPISVIIADPVSRWILTQWNWRVMLITEGTLPLLWLVVWFRMIDDRPSTAKWLSREDRDHLEKTLGDEWSEVGAMKSGSYLKTLFEPQVLVMVAMYFLFSVGATGYLFWLPMALEHSRRLSGIVVGILTVANSWHSDISGGRRGHVAVAVGSAGVFLFLSVWASRYS